MKTLRIVFLAWAACGLLVSGAAAFQEQSFQSAATHGVFEDMYDLFMESPVYLQSFQKNAIWSQLSNLDTQYDRVFYYLSGNDKWQLGGTTDLIGPGRLGVMLDYYASTWPVENQRYAGPGTHYGFGEGRQVDYSDLNGDGVLDSRRDIYSRSEAQDGENDGEIYAGYGMGLLGMDIGFGVRGDWSGYDYTHNPYTNFWMGDFPFDQSATASEVDLITGQTVRTFDLSSSGSWNMLWMEWGPVLAVRSKDAFGLMPNLGLLVNVRPYFQNFSNDYEATVKQQYDLSANDPSVVSRGYYEVKESGVEDAYEPENNTPYSGLGVDGFVRADYTQWGIDWTAWVNFESSAWSAQNADFKHEGLQRAEKTDTSSGVPVYTVTTDTDSTNYKTEGKGGYTWADLRLRGQVPFTGWRLGFGLDGRTSSGDSELTQTITVDNATRFDAGTGDPVDSFTTRYQALEKRQLGWKYSTASLRMPLAIMIDILKNFTVQVSGQYNIIQNNSTITREVLECPVPTSVTTRDNGEVSFDVPPSFETYTGDMFHAEQTAFVETSFSTSFGYGITWKPWENLQIDLTGFVYVDEPWCYQVSCILFY